MARISAVGSWASHCLSKLGTGEASSRSRFCKAMRRNSAEKRFAVTAGLK
jgi:hypothetical protein